MGNAATRSLERVAAAMGALESAPIEFQATCDVVTRGADECTPSEELTLRTFGISLYAAMFSSLLTSLYPMA